MSDREPVALGTLPTPLEAAPRLAAAIGLGPDDLWVKRDDLLGPGGGGNKVRKLQYTVAAALAAGATTLVTTGAAQSNHARLTAAAGARLGLDVVLVLAGTGGVATGNLALDAMLGARIVWAGDVDSGELERRAARITEQLTADGRVASQIPFGGSNATGARGYVDAGHELLAQLPDLALLVVQLVVAHRRPTAQRAPAPAAAAAPTAATTFSRRPSVSKRITSHPSSRATRASSVSGLTTTGWPTASSRARSAMPSV